MTIPSHARAHRDRATLLALAVGVAGCGGSSDTKSGILDPDRGGILSAPLAAALGKAQVAGALQQMGLGDRPAPYDIHFHRVIYRTVGVNGDTVTASGMLAFPRGTSGPLPMISYQHGTSAAKQNVPSNTSYEEFLRLALSLAVGYFVAAADYRPGHPRASIPTCTQHGGDRVPGYDPR